MNTIHSINQSSCSSKTISTGIDTLDHRLGGGLRVGEVGLITGRHSSGKSTTLVNLAAQASSPDTHVLFLSMEMNVRPLQARRTAISACIPADVLKYPYDTWTRCDQEQLRATEYMDNVSGKRDELFRELNRRRYAYSEIAFFIGLWRLVMDSHAGGPPSKVLVCIDGAHLLRREKPTSWGYLAMMEPLCKLKEIARKEGVAIWCTSPKGFPDRKLADVNLDIAEKVRPTVDDSRSYYVHRRGVSKPSYVDLYLAPTLGLYASRERYEKQLQRLDIELPL